MRKKKHDLMNETTFRTRNKEVQINISCSHTKHHLPSFHHVYGNYISFCQCDFSCQDKSVQARQLKQSHDGLKNNKYLDNPFIVENFKEKKNNFLFRQNYQVQFSGTNITFIPVSSLRPVLDPNNTFLVKLANINHYLPFLHCCTLAL